MKLRVAASAVLAMVVFVGCGSRSELVTQTCNRIEPAMPVGAMDAGWILPPPIDVFGGTIPDGRWVVRFAIVGRPDGGVVNGGVGARIVVSQSEIDSVVTRQDGTVERGNYAITYDDRTMALERRCGSALPPFTAAQVGPSTVAAWWGIETGSSESGIWVFEREGP